MPITLFKADLYCTQGTKLTSSSKVSNYIVGQNWHFYWNNLNCWYDVTMIIMQNQWQNKFHIDQRKRQEPDTEVVCHQCRHNPRVWEQSPVNWGIKVQWKICPKRSQCCSITNKAILLSPFFWNSGSFLGAPAPPFFGSVLRWMLIGRSWECEHRHGRKQGEVSLYYSISGLTLL